LKIHRRSKAFLKTPRPRPDRSKVTVDVEFGTLNELINKYILY